MSGTILQFWSLFVFRFGLGIFESAFNPCAYSMIADMFHPKFRTTANSVFLSGIYFGGGLSSISIVLI
jgi:MFS family permease